MFNLPGQAEGIYQFYFQGDANMSLGLRGFLVAYHRLDTNSVVKKFSVAADQRMFRLIGLRDDSVYLVCVVTRGSARPRPDTQPALSEAWRLEQEAAADSEQLLEADTREAGWLGAPAAEAGPGAEQQQQQQVPSSNDTRYLITRPIVLNLDSASSRCNKIKTPLDPAKLNMVDNKQLSALIGCSSGLMIFFCIIISIVARPKRHKDEDIPPPPRANSLSDSYKSPSFKSRSESLVYDKTSYCNSASSSLTRLNGPEHEVRAADTNLSPINKNTGTLRRGDRRPHRTQDSVSPQKKLSAQSSTDTYSAKMSRQSSSEASGGAVRRTPTQRGRDTASRRHAAAAGGATLDRGRRGNYASRVAGYEAGGGGGEDCIPMIEYSSCPAPASPPQQTLHVPRPGWRPGNNGVDSGNNSSFSGNNSSEYDGGELGSYPPPQLHHQENFLLSRNMHSAHNR